MLDIGFAPEGNMVLIAPLTPLATTIQIGVDREAEQQ